MATKNAGAMATDPKKKTRPEGSVRLSPGIYRAPNGDLVGERGNVIRSAKEEGKKAAKKVAAPTTPPVPTQQQVTEEGFRGGAEAYKDITQQFQDFDPYQMQQKYQQGFTTEMDRARENLMGQFERRNADVFAREREATQLAIAERGLDPNSPAAQALNRDLNDRQDRARQEAMNAAEQEAYAVQQQGFLQGRDLAMMPYQQWQAIQAPYIGGIENQYQQQQLTAQQKFLQAQAAREHQYKLQQLRAMPRGDGGSESNAYADYIASQYGQETQQPNIGASIGTGLITGVGQGIQDSWNINGQRVSTKPKGT